MKNTLAAGIMKHRSITAIVLAAAAGVALGAALVDRRAPNLSLLPQMTLVPVGTAAAPIFVQNHEVTIADWNRCNDDGACALRIRQPKSNAQASYPATGISYPDAMEYIVWLNAQTGHQFRLPTAQEWFAVADEVLPEAPDPIFTDPNLTWASAYLTEGLASRKLEPSGTFSTTSTGISDLDGNVWEWTQDCYAGTGGNTSPDRCPAFYVLGEHESVIPYLVRDPARGGCAVGAPPAHLGVRLVIDQDRYDGSGEAPITSG